MHTFYSNRRDYNDWYTVPQIDAKIDPLKVKLFSKDRFELIDNNNNVVKLLSSPVRDYDHHAGVLILQSNRTYGKTKNGRMLYKCIPNDKTLPIFLIPYDLHIGFTKDHTNKYVLFSFQNWDGKHPMGILRETFGNVDNYSSFCSYQLWCNRLVYSIAKFNRQVKIYQNHNSEESLIQNILQNNVLPYEKKQNKTAFRPKEKPQKIFIDNTKPVFTGSGIIINNGYKILTNKHVVENLNYIIVRNGLGEIREVVDVIIFIKYIPLEILLKLICVSLSYHFFCKSNFPLISKSCKLFSFPEKFDFMFTSPFV